MLEAILPMRARNSRWTLYIDEDQEVAIEAGQEKGVRWLLEIGAWLSDVDHP